MGPWPGMHVQQVIGVSPIQSDSIVVRGPEHGGLELALASEPRPAVPRFAQVVCGRMSALPVRLIPFMYVLAKPGTAYMEHLIAPHGLSQPPPVFDFEVRLSGSCKVDFLRCFQV